MLIVRQILVLTVAASLSVLSGCGQKGNLYHPIDPVAAGRASLPQAIGSAMRSVLPGPAASAAQPVTPSGTP
jgi:predicted small lipoprotein YifL